VGNADNTPMENVSGVTGAGPIWNDFMRTILNGQPELEFERPVGLVQAEVCAASGLLPTPLCPAKRLEWFIRGTIPTEYDTMFQQFSIDRRSGALATDQTPPEFRVEKVYKVLPQEARAWGIRNGVQPPPVPLESLSSATKTGLRLLTPDPYTAFQLSPVIPFEAQRIRFSVAVPPGTRQVEYWLNDKLAEAVQADPWWTWWALIPGEYTLRAKATLQDGSIQESEPVRFRVTSYVPPDERTPSGEVK
jgi:membrane carboxypeptidase/penicillin-binding protein PbpC